MNLHSRVSDVGRVAVERDPEVLDVGVEERLVYDYQRRRSPLLTDTAVELVAGGVRDIGVCNIAEDAEQRAHATGELLEPADNLENIGLSRVETAHHGANGASGNGVNRNAVFLQRLEHADVRDTASAAAAQTQTNLLATETTGDAGEVVHVWGTPGPIEWAQSAVFLDARLDTLAEMLKSGDSGRIVDLAEFRRRDDTGHLDMMVCLQPWALLSSQPDSAVNLP